MSSGGGSYVGRVDRWSIERPTGDKSATGYVLLLFRVYQEDKQWVGVCEELDVSSCGNTLEEALVATFDATQLYLNTIEEMGERARIFKEKGIHISHEMPTKNVKPKVHPGEFVSSQRLALVPS